jgi:alpha-amylase
MMFADVDYHHKECQEDVKNWGVWITKELGLQGFRMDAVQHFSQVFTGQWVQNLRDQCGHDMFLVGEFWVQDTQKLMDWLETMDRKFSLFDAPLLYNFHNISTTEKADLRKVFENSLVQSEPYNAVVSP